MIKLNKKDELIEFKNFDEKLNKLKEWGLISPKATEIKPLLYKGSYVDTPTEYSVIGYILKFTNSSCLNMSYETAVIELNSTLHKIAPAYLKEMKKKNFKIGQVEE